MTCSLANKRKRAAAGKDGEARLRDTYVIRIPRKWARRLDWQRSSTKWDVSVLFKSFFVEAWIEREWYEGLRTGCCDLIGVCEGLGSVALFFCRDCLLTLDIVSACGHSACPKGTLVRFCCVLISFFLLH